MVFQVIKSEPFGHSCEVGVKATAVAKTAPSVLSGTIVSHIPFEWVVDVLFAVGEKVMMPFGTRIELPSGSLIVPAVMLIVTPLDGTGPVSVMTLVNQSA